MKLLTEAETTEALERLNVGWSALPGQGLVRVFETGNFSAGVALLARVAEIADRLDHHPDAKLTYDQVEITLTTHDKGGVTQQDVWLAAEIDAMKF